MKLYHLTPAENMPSIRREGLLPKIGDNRIDDIDIGPAVFMFPNFECVEDALSNWFGEIYDGIDFALLTVELDDTSELVRDETVPFEVYSKKPIDPSKIIGVKYYVSPDRYAQAARR